MSAIASVGQLVYVFLMTNSCVSLFMSSYIQLIRIVSVIKQLKQIQTNTYTSISSLNKLFPFHISIIKEQEMLKVVFQIKIANTS